MTSCTAADPASRTAQSWAGRLAWLKSQGASDDAAEVRECHAGLAYHRLTKRIDAEVGRLSRSGADRLVQQLIDAAALTAVVS